MDISSISFRRFRLAWLVLLLAGCMAIPPRQQTTAWRFGDLPAPLGAQQDQQSNRLLSPPPDRKVWGNKDLGGQDSGQLRNDQTQKDQSNQREPRDFPKTAPPAVANTDRDELPQSILPGPSKKNRNNRQLPKAESAPQIVPSEVTVPPSLELLVSSPARKQVGGTATFYLTLTNSGDRPLERLAVRCGFDEALVFAGSEKREVLQRVERLAAGESKELALSLVATSAGSHCCRFVVTRREGNDDVELASKQVCVEFVTRHVEIDIVGPKQRTEGSRAEFNITLSNRSLKTIAGARAIVSFDKALIPKEASSGGEQKAGTLTWQLGSLGPLERVQLQVEFECRNQAHRACVSVEVKGENVSGSELSGDQDEVCLEIVPVPGTLDLQISDRDDPLEAGKSGTFEVTVENIGLQAARRIVIEAVASENLKVGAASVRIGTENVPLKYVLDGTRLVFDPVDQLEPSARLVYTIEVEALRPGIVEFRASLSSSLSSTPVTTMEPLSIVEP